MRRTTVVPLIALMLVGLVALIGCPKKKAPTVEITANPPDSVGVLGTVNFTATVTFSGSETVSVKWSAPKGTFNRVDSTAVVWTAPGDTGGVTISCIASAEGIEGEDTALKTIKVVGKVVHGEAYFLNDDAVRIPNPGTAFDTIRFPNEEESVPAGALIDSMQVGVDVSYATDTFPDMTAELEGPDGTKVTLWDESTQPIMFPVEYGPSQLAAFKDKPVNGIWKLAISAQAGTDTTGQISYFELDVWYRKNIP